MGWVPFPVPVDSSTSPVKEVLFFIPLSQKRKLRYEKVWCPGSPGRERLSQDRAQSA